MHAPHASAPTVDTTDEEDNPRAGIAVATARAQQLSRISLIDQILQELRETFSLASGDIPFRVETFLCELLSAILLRSYRAYSLEKLFGHGNSGPQGAVKEAIEQDSQEMSFEAASEFAARNGYRRIENVRGNRAPNNRTGVDFFDCVWGDTPMSRKHWDTAKFRQQYRRICDELDMPGPADRMLAKFKRTLEYRFFQSQTIFSYPSTNGTFASVGVKGPDGGDPPRKVWYHQTPLPSEEVALDAVKKVMRWDENAAEDPIGESGNQGGSRRKSNQSHHGNL